MRASDHAAEVELPRRLCGRRRRVLPRQPSHLDQCLLSQRASAERTEQEPMQAANSYSDRAVLHVHVRPYSDGERQVLPAGERNNERSLLFRAGESEQPRDVPGATHSSLRQGLYEDARRELLQ